MQRAVVIGHKALRTDADPDLPILRAGHVEHRIPTDHQSAAFNAAAEHVDRRRTKEFGNEQVDRVVIDLLRLADLLNHAGLHDDDHVGDTHCLLLIVRDEHGRNFRFTLDTADFLPRLKPQARVEIGERLVQQQHARPLHQRARDGDALLLSAGELAGLAIHQLIDLDELRRLKRLFPHRFLGEPVLALEVFQREQDVLQNGQVRIERIALENEAHAALFRRQRGHIVIPKEDFAAGRLLQAAEKIERRALAAAGRTEQTDQLSIRDFKGKVLDRHDVLTDALAAAGKLLGQILQYDFHAVPSFYPLQERRPQRR